MNKQETSGFTAEGRDSMPSLYFDNRDIGALPDKPDELLESMCTEYNDFLTKENAMPRARAIAERVMLHLEFEKRYRAGYYEQAPDDLSNLSEEAL